MGSKKPYIGSDSLFRTGRSYYFGLALPTNENSYHLGEAEGEGEQVWVEGPISALQLSVNKFPS